MTPKWDVGRSGETPRLTRPIVCVLRGSTLRAKPLTQLASRNLLVLASCCSTSTFSGRKFFRIALHQRRDQSCGFQVSSKFLRLLVGLAIPNCDSTTTSSPETRPINFNLFEITSWAKPREEHEKFQVNIETSAWVDFAAVQRGNFLLILQVPRLMLVFKLRKD